MAINKAEGLAAQVEMVLGADASKELQKIEKRGKLGGREVFVQDVKDFLKNVLNFIKTGKATSQLDRECAALNKKLVNKLSYELRPNKFSNLEGTEGLKEDIERRTELHEIVLSTIGILEAVNKKSGKSKELDKVKEHLTQIRNENKDVLKREGQIISRAGVTFKEVATGPAAALANDVAKLVKEFRQARMDAQVAPAERGKVLLPTPEEVANMAKMRPAELRAKLTEILDNLEEGAATFMYKQQGGNLQRSQEFLKEVRSLKKEVGGYQGVSERGAAVADQLKAGAKAGLERRDRAGALQSLRESVSPAIEKLHEIFLKDETPLVQKSLSTKERNALLELSEADFSKMSEKSVIDAATRFIKMASAKVDEKEIESKEDFEALKIILENMQNNLDRLSGKEETKVKMKGAEPSRFERDAELTTEPNEKGAEPSRFERDAELTTEPKEKGAEPSRFERDAELTTEPKEKGAGDKIFEQEAVVGATQEIRSQEAIGKGIASVIKSVIKTVRDKVALQRGVAGFNIKFTQAEGARLGEMAKMDTSKMSKEELKEAGELLRKAITAAYGRKGQQRKEMLDKLRGALDDLS